MERGRLRDGLGRKLGARPRLEVLVQSNIMPGECVRGDGNGGAAKVVVVSPGLVAARRRVMKERLKDGLRAWVQSRGWEAQRRRGREVDEGERMTVRALVRRYTVRGKMVEERDGICEDVVEIEKRLAQRRWRREMRECGDDGGVGRRGLDVQDADTGAWGRPSRAKVLGLRRFWEGVIGSGAR